MIRRLLLLLLLATPASAQTLRIGTQSPFVIDPHQIFLGPDMAVAREIYDSFVGRDTESRWVPALAVSWTADGDHAWVFKLRPGVKFGDGTPFTADDVIYSIDRIMNLESPNSHRTNLRTIVKYTAIDPLTVRIETDRPNAALPGQLTNKDVTRLTIRFRAEAPTHIAVIFTPGDAPPPAISRLTPVSAWSDEEGLARGGESGGWHWSRHNEPKVANPFPVAPPPPVHHGPGRTHE